MKMQVRDGHIFSFPGHSLFPAAPVKYVTSSPVRLMQPQQKSKGTWNRQPLLNLYRAKEFPGGGVLEPST